jgi:preprotein translocase subunit SecA
MQLRTTRLTYVYYAAKSMEGRESGEITDEVLKHLEQAQETIQQMWGLSEWERVAALRPAELETSAQRGLRQALGDEIYQRVEDQPLANLSGEEQRTAILELGRRALTGVYRQLLLGVLTELWVDYLTQMEALRVSVGLEAYAQRDPLVQYKSRASEMFHTLMDSVRQNVVTRMFIYRPRDLSTVQAGVVARTEVATPEVEPPSEEPASPVPGELVTPERQPQPGKSKRRRHKR